VLTSNRIRNLKEESARLAQEEIQKAKGQKYAWRWHYRSRMKQRNHAHYIPKDKDSDYAQVYIPYDRRWTPNKIITHFHDKSKFVFKHYIDNVVDLIRNKIKKTNFVPNFLFSLNNVTSVINGSSNDATIVGPIEWMTINPGTQVIGCK
jgi:hypothetical protein